MKSHSVAFILRHGERADAVPEFAKTVEISYDPCLTPTGLKQAYATSSVFKPYAELFGKEQVYVYSSPLIRCMQTAAQIILGL